MLILLLSCPISGFTQIPNQDEKAFLNARSGIVVLQDEAGRLPIMTLDTLRVELHVSYMGDHDVLLRSLNAYVPTHYEELVEISIPAAPRVRRQPNLQIFAVDADRGARPQEIKFSEIYNGSEPGTIVLLFGAAETVANFLSIAPTEATLIWVAENTPWSQSVAAQLIFGAIDAEHAIRRSFGEAYPLGSGLQFDAIRRLSYAPPAITGFDPGILHDSIAAIVNDGILHGAFPGGQVLVARHGTVVYHETFGYHSDSIIRPVQHTDIYDLASVTKISSALPALMKAYGDGRFELDAPLAQYYPDFRRSNKANLSFRSMLAHNARLRPWIPYWQATLRGQAIYPWRKGWDTGRTNDYRFRRRTFQRDSSANYPIYVTDGLWLHRNYRQRMMRAIRKSPLNEEDGYRYSGLLFYLLPEIVASLNNTDYETYLKETFYEPLGAFTITYNPLRFFPHERIIPTERDSFFRMRPLHGTVHAEGAAMMAGVSANAGLFASTNDLAKLMQLYLNGGYYGGQQLIAEEAVAEFTRCQYCEEGNRRGLGFDKPLIEYDPAASAVAEAASPASFGHSGYTGTFTWADPDSGLLFIFMSNRVYPTRANRGIYIRNIRPRIHTAIYQAMDN